MKISVALCTYNGEKYLKSQINSILNQSIKVDEIIVCDDCSTDKTISILEEYSSLNSGLFKIFINDVNLKTVKNFEKAILLCSGEIIFLSDQDDVWLNNKVETILAYFKNNAQISVVATNGYCIDENGLTIKEKYSIWDIVQFTRNEKHPINYHHLISWVGNIATGATMAIRKNIVPELIPFPIIDGFLHDEWIAYFASKQNKFELLNNKLICYRIHNEQQLGGVFMDKTDNVKNSFIEFFNTYENDNTFVGIKRNLKKIIFAFNRNLYFFENTNANKAVFYDTLINLEKKFNESKKRLRKKYYFQSLVMNVTDKFLNKRQLKKLNND